MNHIISIDQFSRKGIESLFQVTDSMKEECREHNPPFNICNKILASLFYEASSRTSNSFKAAMYKLGGNVIGFDGAKSSSVSKGETLSDTIKTFSQYADVIVLRHPSEGAASLASRVSEVPIINAGDGANEHPTQTLLDLYTIYNLQSQIDGFRIGFIGDNKYSRTVHSLIKALSLWRGVVVYQSAPKGLELPLRYLPGGIEKCPNVGLETIFNQCDVVYVTRLQEERFRDRMEFEKVKGSYCIDRELAERHLDTQIMHPLPRVDEIHPDVDSLSNAVYFQQAKNGIYIRQALLLHAIGEN